MDLTIVMDDSVHGTTRERAEALIRSYMSGHPAPGSVVTVARRGFADWDVTVDSVPSPELGNFLVTSMRYGS